MNYEKERTMAKDKINKAVGNAFEDLENEEMEKTQGAGDTEAETTPLAALVTGGISYVAGWLASK